MSPIPNHTENPKRWREDPEPAGSVLSGSLEDATNNSVVAVAPSLSALQLQTKPTRRLSPALISFLTSLIFHTAFLIVLALIVIRGLQGSNSNVQLEASIQKESDAASGALLASVVISPPLLEEQKSQAEQRINREEGNIAKDKLNADEIGAVQRYQPEQDGTQNSAYRLQQSVAELALVSAVKENDSKVDESGKPGEATFFGAKAYGNRFVFIIDASTSMDGYRWNRAVGELLKSIGQLADGTEFFIIAFHFEPVPIDISRATTRTFLVKGKGSVVLCRKWLRSLVLAPQTMPASSLELALDFEPDAIFLLSDGELRDNSLALLRVKNQKEDKPIVPINTIHLFSNDGKETLETLARENGGSFTAVGGKD